MSIRLIHNLTAFLHLIAHRSIASHFSCERLLNSDVSLSADASFSDTSYYHVSLGQLDYIWTSFLFLAIFFVQCRKNPSSPRQTIYQNYANVKFTSLHTTFHKQRSYTYRHRLYMTKDHIIVSCLFLTITIVINSTREWKGV
jgi:hypothetical protein